MYDEKGYPYPDAKRLSECIDVPRLTMTQRLLQERESIVHRLNEVDAVLAALEANPAIQNVLDLLQKTRCL